MQSLAALVAGLAERRAGCDPRRRRGYDAAFELELSEDIPVDVDE